MHCERWQVGKRDTEAVDIMQFRDVYGAFTGICIAGPHSGLRA